MEMSRSLVNALKQGIVNVLEGVGEPLEGRKLFREVLKTPVASEEILRREVGFATYSCAMQQGVEELAEGGRLGIRGNAVYLRKNP